MSTQRHIDTFLKRSRFAMVGVARDENDFSARLFKDFLKRGYDVTPVNPAAPEIQGKPAARKLQEIRPPVDAALLMTPRYLTRTILDDCLEANVRLVWIFGVMGPRDVDSDCLDFCEEHSIELIAGYCPYMFLSGVPFFHRIHGFLARITGAYPR